MGVPGAQYWEPEGAAGWETAPFWREAERWDGAGAERERVKEVGRGTEPREKEEVVERVLRGEGNGGGGATVSGGEAAAGMVASGAGNGEDGGGTDWVDRLGERKEREAAGGGE